MSKPKVVVNEPTEEEVPDVTPPVEIPDVASGDQ